MNWYELHLVEEINKKKKEGTAVQVTNLCLTNITQHYLRHVKAKILQGLQTEKHINEHRTLVYYFYEALWNCASVLKD